MGLAAPQLSPDVGADEHACLDDDGDGYGEDEGDCDDSNHRSRRTL